MVGSWVGHGDYRGLVEVVLQMLFGILGKHECSLVLETAWYQLTLYVESDVR